MADTNAVLAALEQSSATRAVWHLDADERWGMVRDTLLGHPAVRGGMRPRDLPIDGNFRDMLSAIAAFQAVELPMGNPTLRYRFGDWLYSFAVLIEIERGSPASPARTDTRSLSHLAVYQCFREIRRVLGLGEDGEYWNECTVLQRLIATVGWSIKDWHHLHHPDHNGWLEELASMARISARIVTAAPENAIRIDPGLGAERQQAVITALRLGGRDREPLRRLCEKNLRLMTVMTAHTQSYICRSRRHWLMRGASAWCAQVLSFVRDEIPKMLPGSLLLSDSDVLCSFLVPADCGRGANEVMESLWRAWRKTDVFIGRFPRLAEIPAVEADAELDPRPCFPELSMHIGDPTSLFDLCLPPPRKDDEEERAPPPGCAIPGGEGTARGMDSKARRPCDYVTGDVALTTTPPPWMETRGDNEGGKVEEAFGLTSLIWSLCGTTLRSHWFLNVARALGDVAPGLRMMPVHHGGWLKTLDLDKEPIAFLKLDGDKVGRRFSGTAVPRRPYLSLELGDMVLARVLAATAAVVRQRLQGAACAIRPDPAGDHPSCSRGMAGCHSVTLPADLVYLGGDDVFFCLPESLVGTFLAGFSAVLPEALANPWNELTFTYIVVTLPSAKELDPKSSRMQDANLLASQLASVGLKEVAKKRNHANLEVVLAALPASEHFTCEITQPVPDGAADAAVLRGLHLKIIPRTGSQQG